MKFLVDNQLPLALAGFLSKRGINCDHVILLGLSEARDTDIWTYAKTNGYVIISKDEDFFHLANSSLTEQQIVWVRLGNCRTNVLIATFELIAAFERLCRGWNLNWPLENESLNFDRSKPPQI